MAIHLFFRKSTEGFRSLEEVFDIVIHALEGGEVKVLEVPEKKISFGNIVRNLRYVRRNRGKVNHITGDIQYAALATGRNTVLTVHDAYSSITGSWAKQFLIRLFWFWLPAIMVKRITTISDKSRRELEEIIPFARHKIRVIPNPYNPKLLSGNLRLENLAIINTSKPIVLHLGTKANKNLERTIEALEGLPYKLYIVGKLNDKQAELLSRYQIDFESYFNLPYKEVAVLYHRCSAVCFASLYEGFGMPIIEAQLVGKPIVTSQIDPMPWVAGEGACLVDPYDVRSIRQGIVKVMEDLGYRENLIALGQANVQRFDPATIAGMYEAVYREVAAR
ncbi:MAG: glycosyltransferase family 4 protein [Cyclobacteriaceae bacterium]|nr:glycosyltransferase family 4 protein [Cyclobacteriaceae bacterium]